MSGTRRGREPSGVARRLCLLEQARGRGLEPLGLIGWEVDRGAPRQKGDSSFSSLVASQSLAFVEEDRPRPTAPLLVQAGPGLLRRLHLCTPAEAGALGERLAAQSGDEPRMCAPATLAELTARYLAAPQAATVLERGGDGPLLPWVTPWPRAALLEDLRELPDHGVERPTLLVPLGLLFDPPGLPLRVLEEVMSDPSLLRGLLQGTPFRVLPSRITPLMVSLLLPLRPGEWKDVMVKLRDEVGRRLGTAPGWFPLLPEDLAALCRRLVALHAPAVERSLPAS